MRILIEERRRNDEERCEDRQAIRQFMETMAQRNNDNAATSSKPTIYKMQDPLRYNGGSSELKAFLRALRSNFDSHPHLFPRRARGFRAVCGHRLGTWKQHTNQALRGIGLPDLTQWTPDLFESYPQYPTDFDLLIRRSRGSKANQRNAGTPEGRE